MTISKVSEIGPNIRAELPGEGKGLVDFLVDKVKAAATGAFMFVVSILCFWAPPLIVHVYKQLYSPPIPAVQNALAGSRVVRVQSDHVDDDDEEFALDLNLAQQEAGWNEQAAISAQMELEQDAQKLNPEIDEYVQRAKDGRLDDDGFLAAFNRNVATLPNFKRVALVHYARAVGPQTAVSHLRFCYPPSIFEAEEPLHNHS